MILNLPSGLVYKIFLSFPMFGQVDFMGFYNLDKITDRYRFLDACLAPEFPGTELDFSWTSLQAFMIGKSLLSMLVCDVRGLYSVLV
jgi:hypothetical protein